MKYEMWTTVPIFSIDKDIIGPLATIYVMGLPDVEPQACSLPCAMQVSLFCEYQSASRLSLAGGKFVVHSSAPGFPSTALYGADQTGRKSGIR